MKMVSDTEVGQNRKRSELSGCWHSHAGNGMKKIPFETGINFKIFQLRP